MERLKRGDRVMVLRGAGYNDKYIDLVGVVERVNTYIATGGTVGVLLDDCYNSASSYGCYWLKERKLYKMPTDEGTDERKEANDMKYLQDLNLSLTKGIDYEIVKIKFLDGDERLHYFVLYDKTIVPGNKVVVMTAHHGFALAEIVDYEQEGMTIEKMEYDRQVVCAVDLSPYYNRIEAQKQMYELKKQMDAKVAQLQRNAIYEMMAEKDQSLKSMLDTFNQMSNSFKQEE